VDRIIRLVVAMSVVGICWHPVLARQKPQAPAVIKACALLSTQEVKKHLPWEPRFDAMKVEEEPLGTYGSACAYPSVQVQIMPFSQGFMDTLRKQQQGALETVNGVGDAAYFRNNRNMFAEIFVRVGKHLLTLQADVPAKGIESVKPSLVSLANAFVTKLR
jgi:hypothetical protein